MLSNLFNLFFAFLKVGAFSFGGAYSLLPLIEKEAVVNYGWLSHEEFLEVLGMVEVFPGAISIKYATFVGYKTAGIAGIVAANLGNLVIPVSLMAAAFLLWDRFQKNIWVDKGFDGIKYAVVGMVAALVYQYGAKNYHDPKGLILMALGFGLVFFFKLHPALVVVASVVLAMVIL